MYLSQICIFLRFLKKLKIDLPYDPAIPLLCIFSKKKATPIKKDICVPMFIAAVFTVAMVQKELKCSLMNECIKKLWHIYRVGISCGRWHEGKSGTLEPLAFWKTITLIGDTLLKSLIWEVVIYIRASDWVIIMAERSNGQQGCLLLGMPATVLRTLECLLGVLWQSSG